MLYVFCCWATPRIYTYPKEGYVAGIADFGVLKGKTFTSTSRGNNITPAVMTASTNLESSYQITIDTDSNMQALNGAGLSVGDSVSLSLSFRLDGILNAGAAGTDASDLAEFKVLAPRSSVNVTGHPSRPHAFGIRGG